MSAIAKELLDAAETKAAETERTAQEGIGTYSTVPFANYLELPSKEKKESPKRVPIPIDNLVKTLWERFDGFPRRLGSSLFYHDPTAPRPIRILENKQSLFAWIQGQGHCLAYWANGAAQGFVSQDQLFARIFDKARYYDATSAAPYYPPREDVFPTYGKLPKADPDHRAFWNLVGRFNPADDVNRTILAAFILTPMWYDGVNDRPMCLVDTEDAQGSGKTTVVKMIARLYDQHAEAEYLDIDIKTLVYDDTKIKKELLSAEGRSKRIVLFDNLTGTIKSDALAKLVTGGKVSGMAPYGHGTETRPADFTFYGTMNGASTDEDMTTRSYTMRVKAVENPDPMWENETVAFIRGNRLQILADGMDMIENAVPRRRNNKSRFGVYDATILSAVCRTDEEFFAADAALAEASGRANEATETASDFLSVFKTSLASIQELDINTPVVIDKGTVEWWLSQQHGNLGKLKARDIKNLIMAGHLDDFARDFKNLPDRKAFKDYRQQAFFYGMANVSSSAQTEFQFVTHDVDALKIAFRDKIPTPTK